MKKVLTLILVLMLVVASLATPAMAAKAKTKITLDQKGTVKLELGKTLTITATVTPEGEVKWKSSKTSVASVEGGVVTAHKEGTATITAKVGKKSAKVKIKVYDPTKPTKLTLKEGKKKTLTVYDTLQLTPVPSPNTASAAVSEYTFKSSKKSVASVSADGKVTTYKKGTAKITVTSKKNKKAKAVITLTVKPFKPVAITGEDLSTYFGQEVQSLIDKRIIKDVHEYNGADHAYIGCDFLLLSENRYHVTSAEINRKSKNNIYGLTYGMDKEKAQAALLGRGFKLDEQNTYNGVTYATYRKEDSYSWQFDVDFKGGKVVSLYLSRYNNND